MSKIIGLILASFAFTSCITPVGPFDSGCQYCKSPFDHDFNKGDCIKLNPDLIESWQYSEGIIMTIDEVGKRSYKFSFKHPRMNQRTVLYGTFKNVDADFIKVTCK